MEIPNSHIPHFPLELVPFPGERVNLHIFEPRYRQLIHQIHQSEGTFCIPSVINKKVQPLATEMRLIKIAHQYEDGRLDVSVEGIGVARTIDFFPMLIGWLYPGGSIERLPSIDNGHDLNRLKIIDLVRELWTLLKIDKSVPVLSELSSVFTIGHYIGLNLALEYQLLSLQEELDRQEMVIQHLEEWMPSVKEMEETKRKAGMNGHFRELPSSDWT